MKERDIVLDDADDAEVRLGERRCLDCRTVVEIRTGDDPNWDGSGLTPPTAKALYCKKCQDYRTLDETEATGF